MNIGGTKPNRAREDRAREVNAVPLEFHGHLNVFVAPHVAEDRQSCIARAAYHRAERRRFAPGHELDDWLAAEEEFDQRLAGEGRVY